MTSQELDMLARAARICTAGDGAKVLRFPSRYEDVDEAWRFEDMAVDMDQPEPEPVGDRLWWAWLAAISGSALLWIGGWYVVQWIWRAM